MVLPAFRQATRVTKHNLPALYRLLMRPTYLHLVLNKQITEQHQKELQERGYIRKIGTNFFLTSRGQFTIWRERGSNLPWERLSAGQKNIWRERLIQPVLQTLRLGGIEPKVRGGRHTQKTYNVYVSSHLFQTKKEISDEYKRLVRQYKKEKNIPARARLNERIHRLKNYGGIVSEIIHELTLGEIDLTA